MSRFHLLGRGPTGTPGPTSPAIASGQPPPLPRAAFGIARIAALSDGIFAIAITLLVFGLEVPDLGQPDSADELAASLANMAPQFLAYAQTFFIVGTYWIGHHRAFRCMVREDDRLAWLNLVFLSTVSFMPFPATVVGRYPENRTAVVLFSSSLAAVSLTYAGVWAYARRANLLAAGTGPMAHIELSTALAVTALFVASIPLAFVDLDLAGLCRLRRHPCRPPLESRQPQGRPAHPLAGRTGHGDDVTETKPPSPPLSG